MRARLGWAFFSLQQFSFPGQFWRLQRKTPITITARSARQRLRNQKWMSTALTFFHLYYPLKVPSGRNGMEPNSVGHRTVTFHVIEHGVTVNASWSSQIVPSERARCPPPQ